MDDGRSSTAPKPIYSTLQQQDSDFSYNNQLPYDQQHQPRPLVAEQHGIDGAKRSILFALAVIVIPMLGLPALLVGLILSNRVDPSGTTNPLSLNQTSGLDDDAYYVDFNATTLATISSWSSTVAPLLAVAAMSLVSFPISRRLKENSQRQSTDLPTPFQLSMLLEVLTGSVASLYSLVKYRMWPHKERLASMVRSAFVVLVVASIVAYAITAVDTWLHLVMNAVNISIVSLLPTNSLFGRGFADVACVNSVSNFDVSGGCSVALAVTGTFIGGEPNEAYKTLGNLSDINSVRTTTVQISDASGSTNQTLAYLGPATIPSNHDYQASTLAIGTVCESILNKCNAEVNDGASAPFKCTDDFYGNLAVPSIDGSSSDPFSGEPYSTTGVLYFNSPSLTQLDNTTFNTAPQNPYYLGVWARTGLSLTDAQTASGAFDTTGHGGVTYLLNCTTTAYDLTYSYINGSVTSATATKSNGTTSTSLQAPAYYNLASFWMDTLAYAAGSEPDGPSLSASWSTGYSRIVMGMAAGFTSNRTSTADVLREPKLVSRVPKTPLYVLVALNVVYAGIGVGLAIAALRAGPSECNDVRERISVAGLVALAFEGGLARREVAEKSEMFAESRAVAGGKSDRVGVVRTVEGGWEFTVRQGRVKGEE